MEQGCAHAGKKKPVRPKVSLRPYNARVNNFPVKKGILGVAKLSMNGLKATDSVHKLKLFVTRLCPNTKESDIVNYVKSLCDPRQEVASKLQTKFDS